MSTNRDWRESLKLKPELEARTRFLNEADRSVISTIPCGVLFVMAFWSGASVLAFRALQSGLLTIDLNGVLELIVVDADGCPDIYDMLFEIQVPPSGSGETLWIKEGQIVAAVGRGNDSHSIEANTRNLLRMCN